MMMNKDVADESPVVIITGGTTGLGAAVARLLHAKGYRLLLTALDDPQDLHAEILKSGSAAIFLSADLKDAEKSAQKIVDAAIGAWGRIDAVINCAATISHKDVDEVSESDWDEIFATNLKAPFFMAQKAFPYLKATRGSIVNVSSINAWRPAKKNQLYDSLKAALNNLTEGLALEYLEHGVRVNALLPGGFKTPLVAKWLELYLDRVPNEADFESPSVGSAQRVAQGVVALISPELSWVNGALLPIDGGYRLI